MSEARRSFRFLSLRLLLSLVGLIAVIGIIAYAVFAWRGSAGAANRAVDLAAPRRDTIVATVNASGQIEPAQVARLTFTTPGRVSEVLVSVGDQVKQGDPLARIDARELQMRATQAEAALVQAQANYEKLTGGASPEELAASEAQLRQAEGQFRQVTGSVTSSDISAAQAQLEQAQAQLAKLEGGPKETDVRTAKAQLEQAQAQLNAQRDNLSAAKTNAQLQLDRAVASLTQAQSNYSTAKQNWEYVQATGQDPVQPEQLDLSSPSGTSANKVNDTQRQQYYNAFVQAEAALHSAEDGVQQAQVAYDNSRQQEVSGIQLAEGQLTTAQANLDKLLTGADKDQLAAARAGVRTAQANLNKLRGDQRGGSLDAARAAVDAAKSNLERLKTGTSPNDLIVARAQVQSAQAALDLAKLAVEQTTLVAPFSGTVSEVNLKVGEVPTATVVPIVLADLSSYHVDVSVDEIDIARLSVSQPVTLTLDALPGLELPGTVDSIAPLSIAQSAVTSYKVRIGVKTNDERVRSGLSASADIVVAQKANALLVPRRAVRNERGQLIVDTPQDQAVCAQQPEQRPANIELTQITVETGLSNEREIEITKGLDEQSCVYVEGLDARTEIIPRQIRNTP